MWLKTFFLIMTGLSRYYPQNAGIHFFVLFFPCCFFLPEVRFWEKCRRAAQARRAYDKKKGTPSPYPASALSILFIFLPFCNPPSLPPFILFTRDPTRGKKTRRQARNKAVSAIEKINETTRKKTCRRRRRREQKINAAPSRHD